MNEPIDGGPAFPHRMPYEQFAFEETQFPGMSLRDYFAAKAMAACIAAPIESQNHATMASNVAEDAYRFADAMLKARSG